MFVAHLQVRGISSSLSFRDLIKADTAKAVWRGADLICPGATDLGPGVHVVREGLGIYQCCFGLKGLEIRPNLSAKFYIEVDSVDSGTPWRLVCSAVDPLGTRNGGACSTPRSHI